VAKGLTGLQWSLLDALCENGKLREAVPVEQVICHVYDVNPKVASAVDGKKRALQELRRRTQGALEHDGVPLVIDLTNEHLYLNPIPPKEST
jgi:hypothetical protein